MRFSYLVADYPEIKELDINPLLVTPDDVIALDARVVIDREWWFGRCVRTPIWPFGRIPRNTSRAADEGRHVGYTASDQAGRRADVARVAGSCSTQSIWFRFSYLFKQTTHAMATRYCFIDYDRELGIVAEVEEEGQRKLIGIGRLVADANHEAAEYAVIVVDRWQGHGLGGC